MPDYESILEQYGTMREALAPEATPFQKAVGDFQTAKIEEMQKNLADSGRVTSQRLSQSIAPMDIEVDLDGTILIEWGGEDYAKFIDEGVNGIKRNFGSAYSFRTVRRSSSINPRNGFQKSVKEWMQFKGITSLRLKDGKGKYKTMWLKSEADRVKGSLILVGAIKQKGIAPSDFIKDAFENETEVVKALGKTLVNEWKSQNT